MGTLKFKPADFNFGKSLFIVLFICAAFLLPAQKNTDTITKIYTVVEEMPEYPGGATEMMKFIQKNLAYPEAVKENPPGSATVKFIVNEDGSLSNAEITKSSRNSDIDKALIEMIYKMPKWKAGRQHHKAVKCYFNLPINCILYK
jgi:TonB family protein